MIEENLSETEKAVRIFKRKTFRSREGGFSIKINQDWKKGIRLEREQILTKIKILL